MSLNIFYNQQISNRSSDSVLSKVCFVLIVMTSIITDGYCQPGLHGAYYDGRNFERLIATRTDATIDFTWYHEAPFDGMHPEVYSIRWTGKIKPPNDGNYKFSAAVDDGIRVWINSKLIIDNWKLNDMANIKGRIELKGGEVYDIKVEYFNAMLEGEITLYWEIPSEEDQSWWRTLMSSANRKVISSEYFYLPPNSKMNNERLFKDETLESVTSELTASTSVSLEPVAPPKKKSSKVIKTKIHEPTEKIEESATTVAKSIAYKAVLPEKAAASYLPKTVNFNRKESKILESSYEELDKLAEFLLSKPQLTLRIEGHTDNVGDADKNLELSKRRAFAIASYLVKKDVPAKRIKAEGFGGSKPLFKSENGVYHPQNRRVDFILEEY